MSNNELNAFYELIDDFEIVGSLTDDGKDFIKRGVNHLRQENDYLKMNCPEQNIEHFRILRENKRKIDDLRRQNKQLKEEIKGINKGLRKVMIKRRKWKKQIL